MRTLTRWINRGAPRKDQIYKENEYVKITNWNLI